RAPCACGGAVLRVRCRQSQVSNRLHNMAAAAPRKPFYRILYVQVLIGIALGVLLGEFWPHLAIDMKPLGDGFIKLIKMVISLIVFCTVVTGIAGMNDMKKVG